VICPSLIAFGCWHSLLQCLFQNASEVVIDMNHYYRRSIVPKMVLQLLRAPKSGFSPHRGNSLHRFWQNLAWRTAKFCQNLAWVGCKPPKLKILRNLEYKRPAGAFPFSISTKLSACMRSAFPRRRLKFVELGQGVPKL